jgi:mRNA interferase MazF
VWWCTIGHNIGHELDGRSKLYWRPVLVLRKLSLVHLLGVPLTRSTNKLPHRIPLFFRGKKGYVAVDQVRSLDARRLRQLLGVLSPEELRLVRQKLVSLVADPPHSG